MDSVTAKEAGPLVRDLVTTIVGNARYLGELDGAIGDGDHGINMSKGFRLAGERLGSPEPDLAAGFAILSDTLLGDIGGSMGPIYGTFFGEMAAALDGIPIIDKTAFAAMLQAGVHAVQDLGGAKPGDKTLVDVLVPARDAFDAALQDGADFTRCLEALKQAARGGFEATRDMVARIGRGALGGAVTRHAGRGRLLLPAPC